MASEGASWDGEGAGSTGGADNEHSEQQVDNLAHDFHDSGDVADEGSDDGGDYDPESVAIGTGSPAPEKTAASTPSQSAQSKPKMSGGFLVEASDDEDEQDPQPQPRAVSQPQTQTGQAVDVKNEIPNDSLPNDASPNVTSAMAGINPIALLEARVKEDPRGDMDAWLSLMADYRRRGSADDIRRVYNQFLDVFPQAVGSRLFFSFFFVPQLWLLDRTLTECRPRCG